MLVEISFFAEHGTGTWWSYISGTRLVTWNSMLGIKSFEPSPFKSLHVQTLIVPTR